MHVRLPFSVPRGKVPFGSLRLRNRARCALHGIEVPEDAWHQVAARRILAVLCFWRECPNIDQRGIKISFVSRQKLVVPRYGNPQSFVTRRLFPAGCAVFAVSCTDRHARSHASAYEFDCEFDCGRGGGAAEASR